MVKYLKLKNYWWDAGKIAESDKGRRRDEYLSRIYDGLGLERIICISGIRRSGKTTIMHQVISELLDEVPPQRLVYMKMDDLLGKVEDVRGVVDTYQEITGVDPREEEVYVFIDEIHFLKGWQLQLKYYIDLKFRCRFIISGSSKTLLYKDASESLVGRIRFVDVYPLSFREFARFSGIPVPQETVHPDEISFEELRKSYYDMLPRKEKISYTLNTYLEVGGYPEWFKVNDVRKWQEILVDDYFSLILFRDINFVFKIKDPILLEKLVREVASFSTNRFSYLALSNRLDADRETIKLYLYYLESSMLIFISEIYARKKKARERREKKIYFWEEGMRRALTFDDDPGKAVENVVAWHLSKSGASRPYYWKNTHEVDFIYQGSRGVVPVEVKFSSKINASDVKGLTEFLKRYPSSHGIVVTRDLFDSRTINGKKAFFIPAWLFLISLD